MMLKLPNRFLFSQRTLRELLRLALPMVVSQGTFALMIFTDRYFMAQIDAAHMAAITGTNDGLGNTGQREKEGTFKWRKARR